MNPKVTTILTMIENTVINIPVQPTQGPAWQLLWALHPGMGLKDGFCPAVLSGPDYSKEHLCSPIISPGSYHRNGSHLRFKEVNSWELCLPSRAGSVGESLDSKPSFSDSLSLHHPALCRDFLIWCLRQQETGQERIPSSHQASMPPGVFRSAGRANPDPRVWVP